MERCERIRLLARGRFIGVPTRRGSGEFDLGDTYREISSDSLRVDGASGGNVLNAASMSSLTHSRGLQKMECANRMAGARTRFP